jgi:hypothetical protein
MKTERAFDWRTRAARVLAPCAAVIVIAGCGGAESPAQRTESAGVAGAVQMPAAAPSSAPAVGTSSAAPEPLGGAAPGLANAAPIGQIGSQGNVVVASVLPRPRTELSRQAPGSVRLDTPARWLDVDLPQGTASQPVVVVVPGALPQEAASLGLDRAKASRLAR